MIPVIISGGSGTRLWPVSRSSYPKQFCEFYDNSFLRNSLERLIPLGTPMVLTLETMKSMTLRTMHEVGLSEKQLILEPFGKNTAPALALLCHWLKQQDRSQEIVGIFPADHLIIESEKLVNVVKFAAEIASKGQVVTLGIQPRYAATGYGYIKVTDQVKQEAGDFKALQVEEFCEKPDQGTAEKFVESGKHYWNSGMLVFKVETMILNFQELMPELWNKISQIRADGSNAKQIYSNIESISIDYGVMEHLKEQVCIPVQMGWSDVGSWDEIARIGEELPELQIDSHANVFSHEATNNYAFSVREKVIGLIGVRNLIVVDTPDAMLISQKGHSEKVREVVKLIREAGLPEATDQKFEIRPWGMFEILADSEKFKAKRIKVDPGGQLSYQSHKGRSEHWIIVEGQAEVTLDGTKKEYKSGEYVGIPLHAKHRIKNIGSGDLVFVEVQTGEYFGEDDIVRYEDDYQRV